MSEPIDQLSYKNDEDSPDVSNCTYQYLECEICHLNHSPTTHSLFAM